jgi:carboxypeptidase PM20D1
MFVRKTLLVIGLSFLATITILAFNTWKYGKSQSFNILPKHEVSIDIVQASQRLSEIVQIQTISYSVDAPVEKDAFLKLHAYIQASFPKIDTLLEREIISDFSLLYQWEGSDPDLQPILLTAHMDVVPIEPGTEMQWTHPPFAGAVQEGYIWGRGTLDMKVSVGGILEAIELLLDQGFSPKRTIYLAFSHDEELGGPSGTRGIVQTLQERGIELLYTLDEGMPITHGIVPGIERPVALIGTAEKGRVSLELTAYGDGGHSSLPPLSTPVGEIGHALNLLETNQMPRRLQRPTTEMFAGLASKMPLSQRVALANMWISKAYLLSFLQKSAAGNASIRTTTAATIIQGGFKPNVLPTDVRAVVDYRILPGDTVDGVIDHVRNTIDDDDIEIRQIGNKASDPSRVSDSTNESFGSIARAIQQIFPDVVVAPGLVIGRTDSRHYSEISVDNYRFLPMRLRSEDLGRIHGIDERIAIANYEEIIRFYAQLIWNSSNGE